MESLYYSVKSAVVNFKVDYCCCFAPLRMGCLITAYLNIIADLTCLVGIANDGFVPTIMMVQQTVVSEDNVSKPMPIIAYSTELAFTVILLCGIYRKDTQLLRVFIYYSIFAVMMSFLVYSMVIAAVPIQLQLAIIFSTVFQMYFIVLVRSLMVDMKMEVKKYELPTLVLTSRVPEKETSVGPAPKNGQEVKAPEVNKRQEVNVQVIHTGQDVKITDGKKIKEEKKAIDEKKDKEVKKVLDEKKDKEAKKVLNEKKDADVKKDKDGKKDKEVKSVQSIFSRKSKEDKKNKDAKNLKDVEKAVKPEGSGDQNKDMKEIKLTTLNEHPKE